MLEALTIDRERISYTIPEGSSKGGEARKVIMRSNRLVAHFKRKKKAEDAWIVIRSKRFRYALVMLTKILQARASTGLISDKKSAEKWKDSWELYKKHDVTDNVDDQATMLLTSLGITHGSGLHSQFQTLEAHMKGARITPEALVGFGLAEINPDVPLEFDYDVKRALIMQHLKRSDVKFTMWTRDLVRGESLSFIVPGDGDVDATMVAVDLASKMTELMDGLSFFNVLRQKFVVENDMDYVKQRKSVNNLSRERLTQLRDQVERIAAASHVEFYPEMPTFEVPE